MRLTRSLKNTVLDNAIRHSALGTMHQALVTQHADWAERVRIFGLGGTSQLSRVNQLLAQIQDLQQELPEDLREDQLPIHTSNCVGVKVGDLHTVAWFNGQGDEGPPEYRIAPRNVIAIPQEHRLAKEYMTLVRAEADYEATSADLYYRVNQVLNSARSVKQLLDLWPEAKNLLPELPSGRQALAPDAIARLNRLLGF